MIYKSLKTYGAYCNDRGLVSYQSKENYGYGTTQSRYAFYNRMYSTPTFKCPQDNDKFTVNDDIGNGALTYPIGLITADEAGFAGTVPYNPNIIGQNANRFYYLYTGFSYWTMTPLWWTTVNNQIDISLIDASGYFNDWNASYDVRPVISLKSDSLKYGTGEITNPFRIESAM